MFHVKHLKINIKMKHTVFLILIIGLFFFSCNQNDQTSAIEEVQTENLQVNEEVSKDETEILNLIRQVLKWGNSKGSINFWKLVADETDTICIGLDMKDYEKNLDKLKKTDFFSKEFIKNYNKIIFTINKKLQNKEYGEWTMDGLPPFNFASDVNAWCSCQEYPYDDPNVWNVDIKVICLNNENGELEYTWGKSIIDENTFWGDFKYKFKVVKENNKWKISYMEGFDYEEGIKGMDE